MLCGAEQGTPQLRLFGCDGTADAAAGLDLIAVRKAGAAAPADDIGLIRCLASLGLERAPRPAMQEECRRAALCAAG
eukprot:1540337-Pyramimonas_sp.AAC.1